MQKFWLMVIFILCMFFLLYVFWAITKKTIRGHSHKNNRSASKQRALPLMITNINVSNPNPDTNTNTNTDTNARDYWEDGNTVDTESA